MRINQSTESSITLNLPKKQRIIGSCLTFIGVLISILLYFLNNKQISLLSNQTLMELIQNLSFWGCLGGVFTFGVLFISYSLFIHNYFTALGHILLLILNSTTFILSYSSIYTFSPLLITGIYLLTHFKAIRCEKADSSIAISERIFLLFHTQIFIPFNEIKQMILQYRVGLGFLKRNKLPHRYQIMLSLFEKDPGFEDLPFGLDTEKESIEFFRPQTLRKTLISKPVLINSNLLNFRDRGMIQMNRFLEEFSRLTGFTLTEENILGNRHLLKYTSCNDH